MPGLEQSGMQMIVCYCAAHWAWNKLHVKHQSEYEYKSGWCCSSM